MRLRYKDAEYETELIKPSVMAFRGCLSDYLVETKGTLLVNDLVFLYAHRFKIDLKDSRTYVNSLFRYCPEAQFYLRGENYYKPVSIESVRKINGLYDLNIIDFGTKKAEQEEKTKELEEMIKRSVYDSNVSTMGLFFELVPEEEFMERVDRYKDSNKPKVCSE